MTFSAADKIALYEARLVSRLTIRRINSILTVKNQIFLNFHTSTIVVARQFEKMLYLNSHITCYFHSISKLLNRQNLKFYNLSCSFNRINVHPPFVSYYNAIISITFCSLVDILSISPLNVESSSINIISNPAVFVVDLLKTVSIFGLWP